MPRPIDAAVAEPAKDLDVLQCGRCGAPAFRPGVGPFACRSCGCAEPSDPPPYRIPHVIAVAAQLIDPTLDEYRAAEVLFQLRFPDGWGCAACGHPRATHLRTRPRIFECNRCGKPMSVTAGTALHGCRVPLDRIVFAAWLLAEECSFSARGLAKILGVAVETAWSLGHRLRAGFLHQRVRLSGELVLSPCNFHLRPPYRQKRPRDQARASFKMLWDRSRRVAIKTGRPDHHSLRRFLDQHGDADRPLQGPERLGPNPKWIGNGTHHGVTDRWLPFYACAIAGWQNARVDDRLPLTETIRRAMMPAAHPFAALRPRWPPSASLSSWADHEGRYFETVRSWGYYPWPEPPEPPEPPTGS